MKITTCFEVWNKPDSGPITVEERDEQGRSTFMAEQEARNLADRRKRQHPHMDWVVVRAEYPGASSRAYRFKIHDTSTAVLP